MDIGSRPITPATENRQARGIEKISAYGRRKPCASASSALVIGGQTSQKPHKAGTYTGPGANMFSIPPVPDDHPPVACRPASRPWLDGGMPSYDAFLLLSFGGPEGPDDVLPFLENVTRGRGVPRERLAEVAEHYYAVGGVSPINAQCRELLANVRAAGLDLPDVLGEQELAPVPRGHRAGDGRRRRGARDRVRHLGLQLVLGLPAVLRRHRPGGRRGRPARAEDRQDPPVLQPPGLHRAVGGRGGRRAGHARPRGADGRPPGLHRAQRPGRDGRRQRQPHGRNVGRWAGGRGRLGRRIAMPQELREVSKLISERTLGGSVPFDLAYQSRSGPPSVPWLEPDVNEHLARVAKDGASGVVVAPVGFVSDHMEVVHDLDVEAAETAASLGLPFARAKAPGSTPRFARDGVRAGGGADRGRARARAWRPRPRRVRGRGAQLPGRLLPVRAAAAGTAGMTGVTGDRRDRGARAAGDRGRGGPGGRPAARLQGGPGRGRGHQVQPDRRGHRDGRPGRGADQGAHPGRPPR